MEYEAEKVSTNIQWFRTHDRSLSLIINGRPNIVSGSHPFVDKATKACIDGKPYKAVAYMRMHQNVSKWADSCPVKKINGVWHINDRVVYSRDDAKSIEALHLSAVDESVITAVLSSWAKAADTSDRTAAAIIDTPIATPDSCEISFYGWVEYLRRYGSAMLDAVDDFDNKRFEVLSRSLKSNRRAFTLTISGRSVLAIEVPSNVDTCEQARDWIENNVSGFSPGDIAKRFAMSVDPEPNNFFRSQVRKITL